MNTDRPRQKMTAGTIASAAIGLVLLIAGSFFAGLAIGHSLGSAKAPVEQAEGEPSRSKLQALGRWTGDIEGAKPGTVQLDLQTADSARGFDGCNRGSGSWKLDGATVELSGFASTRKACPDLSDPWLFQATAGKLSKDGSRMVLLDREGKPVGTLERAGVGSSAGGDE